MLPLLLLLPLPLFGHQRIHCNRTLLQEPTQLLEPAGLLESVVGTAAECPRFAVTLAGGSLLGALLQAVEHLAGSPETEGQVGCTLCSVSVVRCDLLRYER